MKKDFEMKVKKFNQKVKTDFKDFDFSERFVDTEHYQLNFKKKGTIKNAADIIYGEDAMQIHVYDRSLTQKLRKYGKDGERELGVASVVMEL
ncbi:MAG: hypothetical protein HZB68_01790 [Candidatus Aenigmarchaeota archaeon]|nr:hypothetical protein [Candidatus Aenigmarchaeota archaeon]